MTNDPMTNARIGVVAALVVCWVSVSAARFAQAAEGGDELTLAKGTWSAQAYGAFAGANNEALISANVGVGYHIIDNLSLNIEGAGYGVFQEGDDAAAAEVRLMMRHHLIAREKWSVFADVGQGVIESWDRVPEGGTRLNFIFRAGIGGAYEIDEGMFLIGGVRYFHLSNAQMEGDERNPSINGVEGYLGVLFLLR
jgi:hypothetical protein